MKRIYLDWASAAPVSPAVTKAFARASAAFGNPSAPHTEGREARTFLEDARTRIARLAEVKSDAVIFTSGATEANVLAIEGAINASGICREDIHLLYLPTSHSSVLESISALGIDAEPLVLTDGAIDIEALKRQIRPTTLLVSMLAVCSETGARYDSRAVRRALDAVRPGILLHVDASQLPLVGAYERERLGADLVTLDAQKVGGVRGIGCLIAPRTVHLTPLIRGGGQERGLRSGTEASALAHAFAEALAIAHAGHASFYDRAVGMRAFLKTELSTIPRLVCNEGKEQAPHILNVSLPGADTDYLAALLDEAGVAVSTRSACETDAEGSRVVALMYEDPERANATLRISWGPSTKDSELRIFVRKLRQALTLLSQSPGTVPVHAD